MSINFQNDLGSDLNRFRNDIKTVSDDIEIIHNEMNKIEENLSELKTLHSFNENSEVISCSEERCSKVGEYIKEIRSDIDSLYDICKEYEKTDNLIDELISTLNGLSR